MVLSGLSCRLYQWGIVDYPAAWTQQRHWVAQHLGGEQTPDILCLLEHPPVYTLGTGSTTDFVKFQPDQTDIALYRTERGGEVTYHCPGQLVGYPILDLRRHRQDLHWYLRQLEEVLIQLLAGYGLRGERIAGLTGVWVAGHKVAAIGIKVKRWITMHGFALNVCPDLTGFGQIVPCGIGDRPVGSLAQFVPEITLAQVRQDLPVVFGEVFQLTMQLQPENAPRVVDGKAVPHDPAENNPTPQN